VVGDSLRLESSGATITEEASLKEEDGGGKSLIRSNDKIVHIGVTFCREATAR